MQKICFRADAGVDIGYGHFIRSLALADMLKDEFDCVFYTAEPNPYQIGEMQKVCSYVSLPETTKFDSFLTELDGSEIVAKVEITARLYSRKHSFLLFFHI